MAVSRSVDWPSLARRRLKKILKEAQLIPTLRKVGPNSPWKTDVRLVGSPAMIRLNSSYRGKNYPTDVLSFPAPEVFRTQGYLGDLVICLPTLKKQAASLGHSPDLELEVLLVHGVLHLLGFDHEQGPQEEKRMARWESKVLAKTLSARKIRDLRGLIDRSNSGI